MKKRRQYAPPSVGPVNAPVLAGLMDAYAWVPGVGHVYVGPVEARDLEGAMLAARALANKKCISGAICLFRVGHKPAPVEQRVTVPSREMWRKTEEATHNGLRAKRRKADANG